MLKSQNALLDGNIEHIERPNGFYLVTVSFARANEIKKHLRYDRVIVCTGVRFDTSICAAIAKLRGVPTCFEPIDNHGNST